MSKEINITNFAQMNPQVPQYSDKNQNYLIAGANPVYYLQDGTQEEQVAPLSASLNWSQIASGLDGNIVHMIPSTSATFSVYAVTDTSKVYGITTSGVTSLGYPSGNSQNNAGCYLAIGGGYLFMTDGVNSVYKMALPNNSWSAISGTGLISGIGVHIMEPFLDFIALRDGTSSYTQGGLIKKLDVTSFVVSNGIDLGNGFGVIQMRNLNNKYLAIAGGQVSAGGVINGYPQNYIFLWDGISSRYNYSVKVPGQFIDMKVVDSVLYVAVKVASGKTCIYYLNGTKLTKVFTTQYSNINTGIYAPIINSLFDFKNYLGIQLNSTSDINNPLLIYGKEETGNIEFIHSTGYNFNCKTVGYDGNIFADTYLLPNTALYYLPASGNYQQIEYKSQWIPVKNLQAIDIIYDTPPQGGTDAINVTIYGQGEDFISGSDTIPLTPITSTSKLNAKRTRLDCQGFTGDQVMIKITTVNSTWRPCIRGIKLITE